MGESRERCHNCRIEELGAAMSPFEMAAWSWYWDNVSDFAEEMGIVADAFKEEGLRGSARRFFLRALGMIWRKVQEVRAENVKAEK